MNKNENQHGEPKVNRLKEKPKLTRRAERSVLSVQAFQTAAADCSQTL